MLLSTWLLGLALVTFDHAARPENEDRCRLSGRVSLGDAPVVSAVVRLTRLDPELGALSYSKVRSVRTSETGAFMLEGLPPGAYLVDARGEDCWLSLPVRVSLSETNPEPGSLDLYLERAASIEGRVVGHDGIPVDGVQVFVGDAGLQAALLQPVAVVDHVSGRLERLPPGVTYPRLPLAVAVTDENGFFRLSPVLPDVSTSIRVFGRPPYHDRTVDGITVPRGGISFVDVELARGAIIEGAFRREGNGELGELHLSLFVLEGQPTRAAWNLLASSTCDETDAGSLFRFSRLL